MVLSVIVLIECDQNHMHLLKHTHCLSYQHIMQAVDLFNVLAGKALLRKMYGHVEGYKLNMVYL